MRLTAIVQTLPSGSAMPTFFSTPRALRGGLALCLLTLLAACFPHAAPAPAADASAPASSPGMQPAPLPADASAVLGRAESCMHLAGEFNGDGSDNDREVTAAMNELDCDGLPRHRGDQAQVPQRCRRAAGVQGAGGRRGRLRCCAVGVAALAVRELACLAVTDPVD
ncbi:hypothetical protein YWS52_23460 [Chitiniphilus shinanonensis]